MQHHPRRRADSHRPIAIAIPAPRTAPGHLVILAALAAAALLLFSSLTRAHAFGLFGAPPEVKAKNGVITLPLSDVSDGKAHFYRLKTGGKEVKFFALKSRDGTLRTALDACEACYREKKGYTQDGEFMRCNNCGMKFHATRIMEVKGGCNPVPLARALDAKSVTIREADLAAGARYF